MAIHPFGLIDRAGGGVDQEIIRDSLAHLEELGTDWWTGYSFSWLANLRARNREGEAAERALEIFSQAFTLRNSFHCNGDQSGKGFSKYTYRPFTLEGNFAAAAGIQEMLLQSHGDSILLFPAVPQAWKDVEFTKFRAQGAFVISAQRKEGRFFKAEILSEKGGLLKLTDVESGGRYELETEPGQHVVIRFEDLSS